MEQVSEDMPKGVINMNQELKLQNRKHTMPNSVISSSKELVAEIGKILVDKGINPGTVNSSEQAYFSESQFMFKATLAEAPSPLELVPAEPEIRT